MTGQKDVSTDFARSFDLENIKSRLYYAQNREDLILAAYFHDVKKGFYVDVGAYDPDYDSVTKLFYDNGWQGINIEPQPDRFKKFNIRRKRDINLNVGVSDKKDILTLRSYANQGLSTFSESIRSEYEEQQSEQTSSYKDIKVEVKSLKDIFKENYVTSIQFLKIDVEGLESAVIRGNDWDKYRPEVICIERNHADEEWRTILEKASYAMHFDDGLNAYYVDTKTDRASKFDYVDYVVIARGGGIMADDFESIKKLKLLANSFEEKLWKADVELAKKAKNAAKVESELNNYLSIKYTTKHLVQLIKNRIKASK